MSVSDAVTAFVNTAVFQQGYGAIAFILIAMIAIGLVEAIIPLHKSQERGRSHLVPNLALTFITFGTNLFFNAALVLTLIWLETVNFGLLRGFALPGWQSVVIAVLALDFSFYAMHVAMHEVPALWRFHQVHHADAALDVTTTIRQHPGESVIRYVGLAAMAFALGASPFAFMIYRVQSTLQGLLEHANIKLPRWLDTALSFVITSPNMHKVHHSREPRFTDTNYGNITSLWDRLFFTFTPAHIGADVDYGLEGRDDRRDQSTFGLLAMPWRHRRSYAPSQSAEI